MLSCVVLFLVSSCVFSCLALSFFVLSCLFFLILSFCLDFVLPSLNIFESQLFLSCLILSYLVLSCLVVLALLTVKHNDSGWG